MIVPNMPDQHHPPQQLTVADMTAKDGAIGWDLAQAQFLYIMCNQHTLASTNRSLLRRPAPASSSASFSSALTSSTSRRTSTTSTTSTNSTNSSTSSTSSQNHLSPYSKNNLKHGWHLTTSIFRSILPIVSTMESDGTPGPEFPALRPNSIGQYCGYSVAEKVVDLLRDELVIFRRNFFVGGDSNGSLHPNDSYYHRTITNTRHQVFARVRAATNEIVPGSAASPVEYMHRMIRAKEEWSVTSTEMVHRPEVALFLIIALAATRGVYYDITEHEHETEQGEDEDETETETLQVRKEKIRDLLESDPDMQALRTAHMDSDLVSVFIHFGCKLTPQQGFSRTMKKVRDRIRH